MNQYVFSTSLIFPFSIVSTSISNKKPTFWVFRTKSTKCCVNYYISDDETCKGKLFFSSGLIEEEAIIFFKIVFRGYFYIHE